MAGEFWGNQTLNFTSNVSSWYYFSVPMNRFFGVRMYTVSRQIKVKVSTVFLFVAKA
ncbi:hypothetical protein D3C84_1107560 [compost metagenome]